MARIVAVTAISFTLSFLPGTGTGPYNDPDSWNDAYLDALLQVRDPTPVARELLLVQGPMRAQPHNGDPGNPGPVELIWTLAELRAERVLLPLSREYGAAPAAGVSETLPEVSSRLNQEFALIDENIATLFEAIRIGSIAPAEADQFVRELRRLVADSNARIQNRLSQNAGDARISVEDLVESFGSDRVGSKLPDLGISLPSYPSALAIPLPPRRDNGSPEFRRLSHASLGRYISLTNRLGTRLVALEEEGYFDQADPRDRPSIMHDHLRSLRTELYQQPTELRAAVWREGVEKYFETIAGLIAADTETRLLEQLGTLAETGDLEDESAANLREMKDELSSTFATVRDEYAAVTALRNQLAEVVGGSLVILEDDSAGEGARAVDVRPVDARAVVANSVLVGQHLYAPLGWERNLLLTVAGLLVGMLLAPFRLLVAVLLAPIALLLGAALFPLLFLVADIWVDPLSVATVLVGALGVSIIAAGLSQGSLERTLTGRGVTRLPRRLLRRAALRGGLPRKRIGRRRAAAVVVAPDVPDGSRIDDLKSLHRAISRKITRVGGIVLGEDGPIVFAVFDGPGLAQRTCTAITELTSTPLPGGAPLRCGVEVGELDFYLSPIGGYRATGPAITYARRFCELTRKHRRQVLFGEGVVNACHEEGGARRFEEKGKLVVPSASGLYAFYTLTEIDPPSL